MIRGKLKILICLLLMGGMVLFSGLSFGQVVKKSVHKDKAKLPGGCGSCHKGHGKKGTPMLPLAEKDFCFSCHGAKNKQDGMVRSKKLSAVVQLRNMEDDFRKLFHHPIEVAGVHNAGETLPEKDFGTPRHATCMDCHSAHKVTDENPLEGVEGSKKNIRIKEEVKEYEICYKCHSYSANLPGTQKNKEEEFNPRNRSYHPVEEAGRNLKVPSLIQPLSTSSVITCSDCHSGDGFNAAKGPHGSNYEHILKKKYVEAIRTSESLQNYELCYSCHRRENLLANASWIAHSKHINVTSCKTCHNSHGSRNYPYLIDFEPLAVFPNKDGRLTFMEYSEGKFDCFLKCHDFDHSRDGVVPAGAASRSKTPPPASKTKKK